MRLGRMHHSPIVWAAAFSSWTSHLDWVIIDVVLNFKVRGAPAIVHAFIRRFHMYFVANFRANAALTADALFL